MKVTVERIVGWDRVLSDTRATVGKPPLNKEPSDIFKVKMLVSEHSPIRKLLYEVGKIDSALEWLCVPNCIYRGLCPEAETCGYYKTDTYETLLKEYRAYTEIVRS